MADLTHGAMTGIDDEQLLQELARVVDLRRDLTAELIGCATTICNAMDALPGFVPCGHAFMVIIEGLYTSFASHDSSEILELIDAVRARSEHVSDHRGVEQGVVVKLDPQDEQRALVLVALEGIAAHAYPAMLADKNDQQLNVSLVRALKALGEDHIEHGLYEQLAKAAQIALGLVWAD